MTAGVPYSSYVRPSSHVMRIGRLLPGDITPLPLVVAPTLDRLPGDLQAQLKREFWKRHDACVDWDSKGINWSVKYAAQDWLAGEVQLLERERLSVAFDDYEIRQRAERAADLCGRMVRLEVMQDHARSLGIDPPEEDKKITRVGAAKRLSCPRWWRRQLRKHYTRRAESHLRAMGMVHRHRQVYASDRAVAWRRERKTRDRALLQELVAVSDAGDQLNLFEVVEKSQSNPALRRAELMTRLSGFEEVAQAAGHEALFVTLTTPSAFHRTHANGAKNALWEGFTPREGQGWLSKMWARARAKLKRLSVMFYGFRIAEPHHDGTPHWHMVLFAPAASIRTLCDVLRGVWLSEYASEAGAAEHRCKFQRIDPAKGSATGYLAKYVAKNIDGFQVGEDFETQGQPATESVDRVAAWASAHGIRQFQQLGGPQVSVWRELRRLREAGVAVGAMEEARAAADAGEWAAFIDAVGGIGKGRAGAVQLWKEHTGELTQYDELRAQQIVGVESWCTNNATMTGMDFATHTRWKSPGVLSFSSGRQANTHSSLISVPSAGSTLRDGRPRLVRVRTRCKVWRIERARRCPAPLDERGDAASGSRTHISGAPGFHSSLGPVSITVRGSTSVPSVTITGEHASSSIRGSPWKH